MSDQPDCLGIYQLQKPLASCDYQKPHRPAFRSAISPSRRAIESYQAQDSITDLRMTVQDYRLIKKAPEAAALDYFRLATLSFFWQHQSGQPDRNRTARPQAAKEHMIQQTHQRSNHDQQSWDGSDPKINNLTDWRKSP